MNVKQIIRAEKGTVTVSEWKSGHISPASFPLSKVKRKTYKFGPEYQWRIVNFECLGQKFRILLLPNENKQIFRASLGAEDNGDTILMCHHEWHASEPGWHCHVSFNEVESLPSGVSRSHLKRYPKPGVNHKKIEFHIDTKNALSFAAEVYKFSAQGDLI
jgi:hypothetical protein